MGCGVGVSRLLAVEHLFVLLERVFLWITFRGSGGGSRSGKQLEHVCPSLLETRFLGCFVGSHVYNS